MVKLRHSFALILVGYVMFFFVGCADEQGNLDTNVRHITTEEFLHALNIRRYNVPPGFLSLLMEQTALLVRTAGASPDLSKVTDWDVLDLIVQLANLGVGVVNSPAGKEAIASRNLDPLLYPLYPMLNAMIADPQDPIQSTIDLLYGMLTYPGGLPAVMQGLRPLLVAMMGENPIVDVLAPPLEAQ